MIYKMLSKDINNEDVRNIILNIVIDENLDNQHKNETITHSQNKENYVYIKENLLMIMI